MKLKRLLPIFLAITALTGCDTYYGPVLLNRSTQPIGVVATISGRVVTSQLQPNQALWQARPNLKLEALTIDDGSEKKEKSSSDIDAALAKIPAGKGTMIEIFSGGRIDATTPGKMRP